MVEFALAPPNWGLPDWLTIIGFPAGVAALVMGALQLRQAREQSEAAAASAGAAEAAILRTERKLADVQLVSLLQEIPVIQRELEIAVRQDNEDENIIDDVIRHLGDYARLAAEAQAILERRPHGPLMLSVLRDSAAIVGEAKNEIIAESKSPEIATRKARGHIETVVAEGARIVGAMKAFTTTEEDDRSDGRQPNS